MERGGIGVRVGAEGGGGVGGRGRRGGRAPWDGKDHGLSLIHI